MEATDPQSSSPRARALVLARWNSWVHVWFPETDVTTWVDLGNVDFQPVRSEEPPGPCSSGPPDRARG